jgi:membrane fusion protein (multidrug efflux system)
LKPLAAAALGIGVAAGSAKDGYEWWRVGRFIETTDDAYARGNVAPVSPHVAGFIGEILVADNQRVAAGQLLIRLDPRDFRAAVARAEALAEERQARLASLEAKYILQQHMIAQAEADLTAKSAKAAFASEDALRYRNLAATGYGTRQTA